jgi:membrane fusion protein (multidrug efflux system)
LKVAMNANPMGRMTRHRIPGETDAREASTMSIRGWIGSLVLVALVGAAGVSMASWKSTSLDEAAASAQNQPEPTESVEVVAAGEIAHAETATAVGTVVARRSITLENEVAGTVERVMLSPGAIVEEGTVLVELDTSVEQAELEALRAEAALSETLLDRMERLSREDAVPELDVFRARAERDVRVATIERTRALIERKTIRAPFRARIGIADVHPGQYLNVGTLLTTLQGVDETTYVDFDVAQQVAAQLAVGSVVEVVGAEDAPPIRASIIAVDSRVDTETRNTVVRAEVATRHAPAPGAAVRVRVPVGPRRLSVAVPVSALRKGPAGDHVFVVTEDPTGDTRVYTRLVETGAMVGDEILVRSGLAAGERVASVGSFKLRDGGRVRVTNDTEQITVN